MTRQMNARARQDPLCCLWRRFDILLNPRQARQDFCVVRYAVRVRSSGATWGIFSTCCNTLYNVLVFISDTVSQ